MTLSRLKVTLANVIRLTSRATILLSFDGNHIRIPNATVFKSRIINYSRNAERRFNFALSVASDCDLNAARAMAEDTLNSLPFVLKSPEASVWIESVDDFWVTLNMAGWIDQNETSIVLARSEAIRLTQAAFDTAGISAPVPTYRLENMPTPSTTGVTAKPASPAQKAAPAPVHDVEATADKELAEIVDQERAELARSDLLNVNAGEE
jgi:small conductance mechanosensitive channel